MTSSFRKASQERDPEQRDRLLADAQRARLTGLGQVGLGNVGPDFGTVKKRELPLDQDPMDEAYWRDLHPPKEESTQGWGNVDPGPPPALPSQAESA